MRQRACVGHGPGWLSCQVDICSVAAAVAGHHLQYFTQYREENFMLSYTKRLRLLGDEVPPLAPDPLPGLYL